MKRAPPSSYVDREPHSIRISHPSNPTHPTPLPIQNDSSTPSKPAPPPASCRPSCPGINPTNSGISRPGRKANPSFGDKQAASQSAAALLKPALSQSAARVLPQKLYFPGQAGRRGPIAAARQRESARLYKIGSILLLFLLCAPIHLAHAGNVSAGGDGPVPGSSNVLIGLQAAMKAATDTDEIVIGANTTGKGSDSVVIGDTNITDVYFGSTSTCTNGVPCEPGSTASNAGAGGAVVLHAAALNSFSDIRLKKDIQDSDLGLDFIEKLRPVSYYFKAGDPLLSYGFIAQEVEKALGDRATSMVTQANDEMKTYELNYSSIIAPVVKSIQQQQQEIDDLKQLVAAQQKEIGQMKQLIQTLHAP
jgi:hypothetical protein